MAKHLRLFIGKPGRFLFRFQSITTTAASGGSVTGRSYNYRDSLAGGDRAVGIQGSASYPGPQSIMVNYRNNRGE